MQASIVWSSNRVLRDLRFPCATKNQSTRSKSSGEIIAISLVPQENAASTKSKRVEINRVILFLV